MNPAWLPVHRDFVAWMRYRNLAESTQRIYGSALVELARFLPDDTPPSEVSRRDIEGFIRHRLAEVKPATVSADFPALQQFWKWMVREDEIATNPMDGAEAPIVPEQAVAVLTVEQMRAVLDTAKGNDLVSRRDTAIIRLLIDTGGRLGEIAGMGVEDVDFEAGMYHVVGKGRRGRDVHRAASLRKSVRVATLTRTCRAVDRTNCSRRCKVCRPQVDGWILSCVGTASPRSRGQSCRVHAACRVNETIRVRAVPLLPRHRHPRSSTRSRDNRLSNKPRGGSATD